MRRALEMTVIEGIKTSVPLHLKILNEPDFQAGRLSTALHGPLHAEAEEEQPGRDARRAAESLHLCPSPLPLLHAIVDVDVAQRARLGARWISRAPSSTAARSCFRFAPSSWRPARSSTLCDAVVEHGRAATARRHRQRPRRPGACWRAQPACTSGRTICRRPTPRARRAPTRSSASRRTRSRRSRPRLASRSATSPSVRCSAHDTKDTGYDAVGLELVSTAARLAGGDRRSWPSAASRSTTRSVGDRRRRGIGGRHQRPAGATDDPQRTSRRRIFSVSSNIAYSR